MSDIEHSLEAKASAAAYFDRDTEAAWAREVLEVLRGRREQVESLRQQLEGAVDALKLIAVRGGGTWTADRCLVEAREALRGMGVGLDTTWGR